MKQYNFLTVFALAICFILGSLSLNAQCAVTVEDCPLKTDAENVSLPVIVGRLSLIHI